MTTANKLTILRIALIPVFLVVLYLDFAGARWWALGIFIVACLTDFADGYIARHYNQITISASSGPAGGQDARHGGDVLLCRVRADARLVPRHRALREFAVSGMRLVAVEQGRVIAAAWSGKVKTASTMVCLCLMLVFESNLLNVVCIAVIVATTRVLRH